jgi:hypothetical protein
MESGETPRTVNFQQENLELEKNIYIIVIHPRWFYMIFFPSNLTLDC